MNEEFLPIWDFIYVSGVFLGMAVTILSVKTNSFFAKFALVLPALHFIVSIIAGKPIEFMIFSACLFVSLCSLFFAKRKREKKADATG